METVGLVGVGAMGLAIVERFQLAGVQTVAYDVVPAAVERAAERGATPVSSPAAVAAAADIVGVIVRTDEQVVEAVRGRNGVLEELREGKILILHSTIDPRTTRQLEEIVRGRGAQIADACIVGVPAAVRAGEAVSLVGADAGLMDRVRPHLLRVVRQVFHMGPVGSGNAAKIIKNLVTGSERLILEEAVRIGEAAGISYVRALDMMREAHARSLVLDWERAFDATGASSTPFVGTNLYQKDLPLAEQLAEELGVDAPITRELVAAGKRLVERGRRPPEG